MGFFTQTGLDLLQLGLTKNAHDFKYVLTN